MDATQLIKILEKADGVVCDNQARCETLFVEDVVCDDGDFIICLTRHAQHALTAKEIISLLRESIGAGDAHPHSEFVIRQMDGMWTIGRVEVTGVLATIIRHVMD